MENKQNILIAFLAIATILVVLFPVFSGYQVQPVSDNPKESSVDNKSTMKHDSYNDTSLDDLPDLKVSIGMLEDVSLESSVDSVDRDFHSSINRFCLDMAANKIENTTIDNLKTQNKYNTNTTIYTQVRNKDDIQRLIENSSQNISLNNTKNEYVLYIPKNIVFSYMGHPKRNSLKLKSNSSLTVEDIANNTPNHIIMTLNTSNGSITCSSKIVVSRSIQILQ